MSADRRSNRIAPVDGASASLASARPRSLLPLPSPPSIVIALLDLPAAARPPKYPRAILPEQQLHTRELLGLHRIPPRPLARPPCSPPPALRCCALRAHSFVTHSRRRPGRGWRRHSPSSRPRRASLTLPRSPPSPPEPSSAAPSPHLSLGAGARHSQRRPARHRASRRSSTSTMRHTTRSAPGTGRRREQTKRDEAQTLTDTAGPRRELGTAAGREHQEGRLHTRLDGPLCLWQEPDAPRRRHARRPANLRHHRDRERGR